MSTGTKTKANFYFPRRKKHDGAISEYILLLKLIDNMQIFELINNLQYKVYKCHC